MKLYTKRALAGSNSNKCAFAAPVSASATISCTVNQRILFHQTHLELSQSSHGFLWDKEHILGSAMPAAPSLNILRPSVRHPCHISGDFVLHIQQKPGSGHTWHRITLSLDLCPLHNLYHYLWLLDPGGIEPETPCSMAGNGQPPESFIEELTTGLYYRK